MSPDLAKYTVTPMHGDRFSETIPLADTARIREILTQELRLSPDMKIPDLQNKSCTFTFDVDECS